VLVAFLNLSDVAWTMPKPGDKAKPQYKTWHSRDVTGQGKACQNKQKLSQGTARQGKSSEGKPIQAKTS